MKRLLSVRNSGPARQHPPLTLQVEPLEERQMLSSVTIYAFGETGQEQMQLLVNDQVVETFDNVSRNPFTGGVTAYSAEVGNVTPDQIKVQFTNDVFDPANGIDRNLFVDRIQIDLDTYQTESTNVFSTGTWTEQDGIVPGFGRGQTLHANGYFQYGGNTGAGSLIEIDAQAQDGPVGFDVLIDGNVVETFFIGDTATTVSFQADQMITADDLRIAFSGDQYDPANGIDKNLIIDKVVIDGNVFETEASSVFSTGTWTPSDGIVAGFGRGETLHANGYFQYSTSIAVERFERIDEIGSGTSLIESDPFSGSYATLTTGSSTSGSLIEMFNANGTRDTSFGSSGVADLEALSGLDFGNDVVVTDMAFFTDGSLLLVGRNFNFVGTAVPWLFKLTPDGNVDQSFANGFLRQTNLGILNTDSAGTFNVVIDDSDRVTVLGNVWNSKSSLHARYLDANGNLDTSRGFGGNLTFFVGPEDTTFRSSHLLSDGSILFTYSNRGNSNFTTTFAAKIDSGGMSDTSYGSQGIAAITPQSEFAVYSEFAVDSQDRLVMVSGREVARLNAGGGLDEFGTFGRFVYRDDYTVENNGQRFDFDRLTGVAIDSQDRIVLAAQNRTETGRFDFNYDDTTIVRITNDGFFDNALNEIGIQTIGFASGTSSDGNALEFDDNDNLLVSLSETGPITDPNVGEFGLSRLGLN